MNRIVIIGTGNVGLAYAYAIINQNTNVDELILIDKNEDIAIGNAIDLSHGATSIGSKIIIKSGNYSDCKDAKIVLIAAGHNQEVSETRLDLINKNSKVVKQIVSDVVSSGFSGIFLVATNPVDIMTYITRKYSNFEYSKVIGSGTIIDTERLKYLISKKVKINPSSINAFVIGEHGDSSLCVWSNSKVGVVPIKNILSKEDLDKIENDVKLSAYRIIEKKGETSYGIGMCLVKLTNSILLDQNLVLTVSSKSDDIYISQPAVINKDGIKGVMKLSLDDEELKLFERSKNIIRNSIRNMED